MKPTKRLNIEEKSGYYFMNDFDPKLLLINEITFSSASTMFESSYEKESNTPYIVFNDIEWIFRKSGINKYLVFCETQKNKKMLENYTKIIDELRDQVLFITEENSFVMGEDFTKIKFKTRDGLSFIKKNNVSVCVISLYSLFEDDRIHCPQIVLHDCFYEYENSDSDSEY